MMKVLSLVIFCIFISACLTCDTDENCYLNGVCTGGSCVCDAGWTSENCSLLNLQPAPVEGAYGYSPNVSSWGGVPILVGDTYHLYVSEMVEGCGLCTWGSNSEIVHATSQTLLGPYTFHDVALEVWAHNPQIAVDFSSGSPVYLLFHIGTASGGNPKNCTGKDLGGDDMIDSIQESSGVLHTAASPDGPWTPQNPPGLSSCNNPAPYVFSNGTIVLVCTWFTQTAHSWKGPWSRVDFDFEGPAGGNWEDPFIWVDKRGHWKLLSHVWISVADYSSRVAGFAYSTNGVNWIRSGIPPFTNEVKHVNGQTSYYSTRERPKLFFGPDIAPIALFNGVGGVPNGDKDKCGIDWTFTLAQPVA